jgi:uncharacterized metal-binding protein
MRRAHPSTGDPGPAGQYRPARSTPCVQGATRSWSIVVAGELSRRFALAFDGMTLRCAGGQTAITGMVVDQSQLHGLLDRVGELGLELVSVNAIGDEDPSAGVQRRRDDSVGSPPA